MKTSLFLFTAALACGLISSAAAAPDSPKSREAAEADSARPVLVSVVAPTEVPRTFEGATAKVALTVDADGRPSAVTPAAGMPASLARRLLPAVEQWRFQPARVDGRAVAMRVILPVKLVAARD